MSQIVTSSETEILKSKKSASKGLNTDTLRSQFVTSNELSSKRRYNPYAFTEQGIYMLMTVLKGDLAIVQSIALIRLFKNDNKFHDRYIVIDYTYPNEAIYHSGPSSKNAGHKISTITKIDEMKAYRPLLNDLLRNIR